MPTQLDHGQAMRDAIAKDARSQGREPSKELAPTQKAEAGFRQRRAEQIESYFAEPDAVVTRQSPEKREQFETLLANSADPEGLKARTANAVFLKDAYGFEGDMTAAYPELASQYAKRLGLHPESDDKQLYGAISEQVKKRQGQRQIMTEALMSAQSDALQSGDWREGLQAAVKSAQASPDWEPQLEDAIALGYRRIFEEADAAYAPTRAEAKNVYNSLKQEFKGERPEGLEESRSDLLDRLATMPRAERQKVYRTMATMAEADGTDPKGFFKQTGEAIGRSVSMIAQSHGRMAGEDAAQRVLGAAKKGERVKVLDTENGIMLAVGAGMAGGIPRDATPEEMEQLAESAKSMQARLDIQRELNQLGQGVVDPIEGNAVTDAVWYPFWENVGFLGQAMVPYLGVPATFNTIREMRLGEALDRDPDGDRGELADMMTLSAIAETAVETVSARMLIGKQGALTRLLKPLTGPGDKALQVARMFGVQQAEQFTQEMLQDALPLAIQQIGQALQEDDPAGTDWAKEWKEYGMQSWDTFWAVLMSAGIGTGAASMRERSQARWAQTLKLSGIKEERILEVMSEADPVAREAIYHEAWKERDAEVAREMAQRMDAELAEAEILKEMGEAPQIRQAEDGMFEVYEPSGNEVVGRSATMEGALGVAEHWREELRNEQDRFDVGETIAWLEARIVDPEGEKFDRKDVPRSLQDKIDAGEISWDEAMKAIEVAGMNLGSDLSGVRPEHMLIFGENRTELINNVVKDVSTIWKNANATTPFEEKAEGYIHGAILTGEVAENDVLAWKQRYEAATGAVTHGNTADALIEWFSSRAVDYIVSGSRALEAAEQIPGSIRRFLRRLSEYARLVLRSAAVMAKVRREGKLDESLETHLRRALKLDDAFLSSQFQAQEIEQALRPEIKSERKKAPGKELLDALRKIKGGISTTDKAFQGELKILRETLGPGRWMTYFRKDGQPLDDARRSLKDSGFIFDTPPEMIQGIQDAAMGMEVYTTPGEGGMSESMTEHSFSMAPIKPELRAQVDALPPEMKAKADIMRGKGEIAVSVRNKDGSVQLGFFGGWYDMRAIGRGFLPSIGTFDADGNVTHGTRMEGASAIVAAEKALPNPSPATDTFSMVPSAQAIADIDRRFKAADAKRAQAPGMPTRSLAEIEAVILRGGIFRDEAMSAVAAWRNAIAAGPQEIRGSTRYPYRTAQGRSVERESIPARMETEGEWLDRAERVSGIVGPAQAMDALDAIDHYDAGGQWPARRMVDATFQMGLPGIELRKIRMRRLAERMAGIREQKGSPYSKEIMARAATWSYEVLPNKRTVELADGVLAKGFEEALKMFEDPASGLKPPIRHAVGMMLSRAADFAGDSQQAMRLAERLAEMGTESGQGVQIWKLFGTLLDSPEKARAYYARQVKKAEADILGTPTAAGAIDVAAEVQKEANKLFNQWITRILGAPKRRRAPKPEDLAKLPDITFSLIPALRPVVAPARRLLTEFGADALDAMLVEKYGEKIRPHLAEIKMEIMLGKDGKRKAAAVKKKQRELEAQPDPETAKPRKRKRDPSMWSVEMEVTDEMWERIRADGLKAIRRDYLEALEFTGDAKDLTDAQWEAIKKDPSKSLRQEYLADLEFVESTEFRPESEWDASGLLANPDQLDLSGFEGMLRTEAERRMKLRNLDTPKKIRNALDKVIAAWDGSEIGMAAIDRIFRESLAVPEASPEFGERLARMAESVARLPDKSAARATKTQELMDAVHDELRKADAIDLGIAVWYSNILSGYNTDIRNIGDTGLQVTADLFLASLSVNPVTTVLKLRAAAMGAYEGARFGASEAYRHLRTGEALVGRETVSKFGARSILERHTFKGGKANPFNWLKIVGRKLVSEDTFWFQTSYEAKSMLLAMDAGLAQGLKGEALETFMASALQKAQEATNDFALRAEREFDALIEGDTADTREQWVKRRVMELKQQSRDGLLQERASDWAARSTYNYKPDGVLGVIVEGLGATLHGVQESQLVQSYGWAGQAAKLITKLPLALMPFIRIVANVTNKQLDYTPVGIVRRMLPIAAEWKAGKPDVREKGLDERDLQLRKGIFGTLAIVALMARDPEDEEDPLHWLQIHGEGPDGFNRQRDLRETGWLPYSVQVGDRYFSLVDTPFLLMFAWVGRVQDAKRYDKAKLEDQDFRMRMAYAATGAFKTMLEKSVLDGISSFFEAASRGEEAALRGMQRLVARSYSPSAMIPFSNLLAQANRDFDPVRRDTQGLAAELLARVPLASRLNKPSLNSLGEDSEARPLGWLWSAENKDGADARLWRWIADNEAHPPDAGYYRNRMDAEMYYAYIEERGKLIKQAMEASIEGLEGLEPEGAQAWMSRVSRAAGMEARAVVGYGAEESEED